MPSPDGYNIEDFGVARSFESPLILACTPASVRYT